MAIRSGVHSDRLMARIIWGAVMQKSSQDRLLSSTTFLDSLDESVGTSDIKPSPALISESMSSLMMLNAFDASSNPALVKYQSGT